MTPGPTSQPCPSWTHERRHMNVDLPKRHHRRGQEHCPGHKTACCQLLAQLWVGCCLMWRANRSRVRVQGGGAFTFSFLFPTRNLLSGFVPLKDQTLKRQVWKFTPQFLNSGSEEVEAGGSGLRRVWGTVTSWKTVSNKPTISCVEILTHKVTLAGVTFCRSVAPECRWNGSMLFLLGCPKQYPLYI